MCKLDVRGAVIEQCPQVIKWNDERILLLREDKIAAAKEIDKKVRAHFLANAAKQSPKLPRP